MRKTTNYEVPHDIFFIVLLYPRLFSVSLFSSALNPLHVLSLSSVFLKRKSEDKEVLN
jgi:hypothetical protein